MGNLVEGAKSYSPFKTANLLKEEATKVFGQLVKAVLGTMVLPAITALAKRFICTSPNIFQKCVSTPGCRHHSCGCTSCCNCVSTADEQVSCWLSLSNWAVTSTRLLLIGMLYISINPMIGFLHLDRTFLCQWLIIHFWNAHSFTSLGHGWTGHLAYWALFQWGSVSLGLTD